MCGGPQSQPGWEEKDLSPLLRIAPHFLSPPALSLVTLSPQPPHTVYYCYPNSVITKHNITTTLSHQLTDKPVTPAGNSAAMDHLYHNSS
jgi:hypothetical protein